MMESNKKRKQTEQTRVTQSLQENLLLMIIEVDTNGWDLIAKSFGTSGGWHIYLHH